MMRTTIPTPLRVGLLLLLGGCSFVFDPDSVPAPAADGGVDAGTRDDGGVPPDGGGELPVRIRSFEAEPAEVLPGGYSRLSWVTENATGCAINSTLPAPVPSDSTVVRPGGTTTYTLSCEGEGGPQTREVTVTVKPAGSVVILTFAADRETILPGASSQLTWSASNATSCTVSDGAGFQQVVPGGSGAVTVSPASATEYTLSCAGSSGGTATAKQTIEIAAPTQVLITRFEANPNPVSRGSTFTLRWESENATGCTLSGESLGPSGSKTLSSPADTRTYTLECTDGSGGSATATTTLYVRANAVTIDRFEVTPAGPVDHGSQITLSWDSSNATDCRLDWNAESAAPGVDASHAVTVVAPTTFRLLCSRTDPVDAVWAERTVLLNPLTVSIEPPLQIHLAPGASWDFEATVSGAVQGGVTWSVRETDGGSIDGGHYTAPSVSLAAPSTFHVVARSVVAPEIFSEASVTVHPPPMIDRFAASPAGPLEVGTPTTLAWDVRHAGSCTLGPPLQPVDPTAGSLEVSPLQTTAYELVCTSPGGDQARASATASYQPIIVAVAPSRTSVLLDEPLQFTATVTGARQKSVRWTASSGAIGEDAIFVPSETGVTKVFASSHADPSRSASADVAVFSPLRPSISGMVKYTGLKNGPVYLTVLDWPGATGAIADKAPLSQGVGFRVHDVVGRSLPPAFVDVQALDPTTVYGGETVRFTALIPHLPEQSVQWTVAEPEGGSVTQEGLYTAPSQCPGGGMACLFHVIATASGDTPWRGVGTVALVLGGSTPPSGPLHPMNPILEIGQTMTFGGAGASGFRLLAPAHGAIDSVSGTYTAIQPGTDFVVATGSGTGTELLTAVTVTEPVVELLAFMDVTGSGHYVASVDPAVRTTVRWRYRDALKLTLVDPLLAEKPPAVPCQAFPGDGTAVVLWDAARDASGNEVASEYEVLAKSGSTGFLPTGTRVPAGGQNLAALTGLTNEAHEFMVRAKTGEAAVDGVPCGPVTPGPPTSGFSVSGVVHLGQVPPQATLLVFVGAGGGNGPPSKLWYTLVPIGDPDPTFTIRGVEAGTQMVGAFLDLDGDGTIGPREPNTFGGAQPQPLEVSGDTSGIELAIPPPGMVAKTTSELRVDYQSVTAKYEEFGLEVAVVPSAVTPLRASVVGKVLESGTYVAQEPSDLSGPTLDDGGSEAIFRRYFPMGKEPPPADRWVLTVQSVDGRAFNLEAAATGLVKEAAVLTAPLGDAAVPSVPEFVWTWPTSLPDGARLELSVRQAYSSGGDLWWTELTPATSRIKYMDGAASLPPGTYEWQVRIFDRDGNRAVSSARFSVTGIEPPP